MAETELDFAKLTSDDFEELCFDLLVECGFRKVEWRRGPGDGGRDIEAEFEITTNFVEPFNETWFFECKNHEAGVSAVAFESAFTWADTMLPQHLVLITSSHLTSQMRENIARRKERYPPYKIHTLENKQVVALLRKHSSVARRYFATDVQMLMRDTTRNWVLHDLFPDVQQVTRLCTGEAMDQHSINDIAFLFVSVMARAQEFDDYFAAGNDDDHRLQFTTIVRSLFRKLVDHPNWHESVYSGRNDLALGGSGSAGFDDAEIQGQYTLLHRSFENVAAYALCHDAHDLLEVLVDRNSDLSFRVRREKPTKLRAIHVEPAPSRIRGKRTQNKSPA